MNKKTLITATLGLSLLVSGTALAANYSSPGEIVSNLTQTPIEKVYEEKSAGKSYGQIAQEQEVFEQFKEEMVEYKNEVINQRVSEGIITEENAEDFKKEMEARIANCDGTPNPDQERLGQKYGGGLGFGKGNGGGYGQGRGMGFNSEQSN